MNGIGKFITHYSTNIIREIVYEGKDGQGMLYALGRRIYIRFGWGSRMKEALGKSKRRWNDMITINLRQTERKCIGCTHMTRERSRGRGLLRKRQWMFQNIWRKS